MIKLGIVLPSINVCGGVSTLARFVKDIALESGQFEIKLISLCMSSKDETSLELRRPVSWIHGVSYCRGSWENTPYIHVGALFGDLEFQRYQPRKALNHFLVNCDLIQVVGGSPAWANTVLGLGKPISLQFATRVRMERRILNSGPKRAKYCWRSMMTNITDRLEKRALREVDAIQVINPGMLDYIRQINNDRIVDMRYAPPGVDTSLFHPHTDRNFVGDKYILCVGRLNDLRKNILLLLEAYAQLPRNVRINHRLILAGATPPNKYFWQRVKTLGVEKQVNYIPKPSLRELIKLYQMASIFVLPSDEEGLGIVVLEAMSCGVPVVCTRSGGPEGIISDGNDGFLVPRNDVKAMAYRLNQLLCNLEFNRQMGVKARRTIELRYDKQVAGALFVDTWLNLYKKMVY